MAWSIEVPDLPRKRSARIGRVAKNDWREVPEVGAVRFTIPTTRNGLFQGELDFPEVLEVARDLAVAWCESIPVEKPALDSLRAVQGALRHFLDYLRRHLDLEIGARLAQLTGDDFDGYEDWLRKSYPVGSGQPYALAMHVLVILRAARDLDLLDHSLRRRSSHGSRLRKRRIGVRDGYDSASISRLQEVAWVELGRSLDRVRRGRFRANLAQPRRRLTNTATVDQVVRYLIETGPINGTRWAELGLLGIDRVRAHARAFPFTEDLAAPACLLVLATGIERQGLLDLTVEGIEFDGARIVSLNYEKPRAAPSIEKEILIEDDDDEGAGNIVRSLLELTETLRPHSQNPQLVFQGINRKGPRELSGQPELNRLREATILLGEKAQMDQSLGLARLRKSHKASFYMQTEGRMEDFAVNHSQEVAARYYANIPALRPVHDAAIEAGLAKAISESLAVSGEPTIIEDPGTAEAHRVPEDGLGEQVWLATCRDEMSSPFSAPGEACPVPLSGCLNCRNALITKQNLPAILALQRELKSRAESISLEEWVETYGPDFVRTKQILNQFSESQIEEALTLEANLFVSPLDRIRRG